MTVLLCSPQAPAQPAAAPAEKCAGPRPRFEGTTLNWPLGLLPRGVQTFSAALRGDGLRGVVSLEVKSVSTADLSDHTSFSSRRRWPSDCLSATSLFLFAGALERATRASGSQSGCYSPALLNTLESVALVCPRQ